MALAAVSCFGLASVGAVNAFAGAQHEVFVDEKFEENAFKSGNWKTDVAPESVELSCDEETGHISSKYNLENYYLGTTKIEGLEVFQFDIMYTAQKWVAIYLQGDVDTNVNGNGTWSRTDMYNPEMFLWHNKDAGFTGSVNAGGGEASVSSNAAIETKLNWWYSFKMEVTSATTAALYYTNQGEEFPTEPQATVTVKNGADYSFDSLYVLLACEGNGTLNIDNLYVKSDNVNIDENFNDSEISADVVEYATSSALKYEIVKADSFLAFNNAKAGDGLLYAKPMLKEESVVSSLDCLDVTFDLSFNGSATNSVAFMFGLGNTMNVEDGAYRCIFDYDSVVVDYYKNGESTEIVTSTPIDLSNKIGETVRIIVNKNGTVTVQKQENEKFLEVLSGKIEAADAYVGYFGFMTPQENSGTVMIDDLFVNAVTYVIPVTKSVSHNFSNDFFGNEGFEDFLVVQEPANSVYVKDGKLVFDGASDTSRFGSAHQYDDFILDYKICNIYTKNEAGDVNSTGTDKWIGLDIGKERKGETEYGSNVMLAFQITPTAEEVTLWTYRNSMSDVDTEELAKNVTEYQRIPASLFRDIQYDGESVRESDIKDENAVCVRFVSENGNVKLYMKKAHELEYTLYYKYAGVRTTGYAAICCTGYTYAKFDDFSMTNISSVYVNADSFAPEVIEKETTKVVYDKNNTDTNGLTEAALNAGKSGCGSFISVEFTILPLLFAVGVVLMKKQRKSGDEQ